MFGNYLASAIRALQRDKFHAVLNIVGLTVSLAVTFLIALYVKHELSYENFFTEPERVYTVQSQYQPAGAQESSALEWGAPHGLLNPLKADFSDQLTSIFIFQLWGVMHVEGNVFGENYYAVDGPLFEVLDYPILYGDPVDLSVEPNKVILTESVAERFFGRSNVVGETLDIEAQFRESVEVAAVLKDFPANTDLRHGGVFVSSRLAQLILPSENTESNWMNSNGLLFIRLNEEVSIGSVEARLPALVEQHMPEVQQDRRAYFPSLVRLDRLHLALEDFSGNRTALAMLAGVAFLLCVIACFNYINLSTARALTRTKEIGIRKVLGARKHRLVAQFLSETLLTTSLAFVLSLGLAALLLPVFSTMVERGLSGTDLLSPLYLLIVLSLTFLMGLLAGTYPAFFLASAKPNELFEKQKITSGRRSKLRSTMVGTQLAMTIGLIVTATVIYAQAVYMNLLDLGFDQEGVVVVTHIPVENEASLWEVYRQRLAESPYIQMVAGSRHTPEVGYGPRWTFSRLQNDDYQDLEAFVFLVDDTFFDLYEIPTLAGRVFSESRGDRNVREPRENGYQYFGKIVISESAVPYFGFSSSEDALGEMLLLGTSMREVVGVVPDIQVQLGRAPTAPTVYFYRSAGLGDELEETSARIAPNGLTSAIDHAEKVWKDIFPDRPFEYEFLEDRIAVANAYEQRQSTLFVALTILAILVTCLGLFGLVSFIATRRTQEIAIRKVVGAKIADVIWMLLWEFSKPILLASLIAWPIAWVLMRHWLDGFPYRIKLSPWFFIGATALALVVAFLTVIGRTWKAAQTHPAQALKYE